MAGVLNLKRPIASSRDLTDKQLGRVLDRMRELESQPELPGSQTIHAVAGPSAGLSEEAEIAHLATGAQVATIEKLLGSLGWSADARQRFLQRRFKRTSPRLLSPPQANSLTMILFNIAAAKAIRERATVERVSRTMIRAEIPQLKRRLGIDQKPQPIDEEFFDDEREA
jgi:hypothetical protein